MEVGESWAYREGGRKPLVEVTVVKLGTRKPERVLVRFAGEEFEGREEWIPPGRLKVAWADREAFITSELQWDTVTSFWRSSEELEIDAAGTVFDLQLDGTIGHFNHGYRTGVLTILDPLALARELAWDEAELRGHSASFVEGEALFVPWPTTRAIAMRLVERDPGPVLLHLAKEEREARDEAIHGKYWGGRRRQSDFSPPERCAEFDEEYMRPRREALRRWIPAEHQERHDELEALRVEVRRLGRLVERATQELRRAGRPHVADQLDEALGTPVESIEEWTGRAVADHSADSGGLQIE